jgi:hypothetical protein
MGLFLFQGLYQNPFLSKLELLSFYYKLEQVYQNGHYNALQSLLSDQWILLQTAMFEFSRMKKLKVLNLKWNIAQMA